MRNGLFLSVALLGCALAGCGGPVSESTSTGQQPSAPGEHQAAARCEADNGSTCICNGKCVAGADTCSCAPY